MYQFSPEKTAIIPVFENLCRNVGTYLSDWVGIIEAIECGAANSNKVFKLLYVQFVQFKAVT